LLEQILRHRTQARHAAVQRGKINGVLTMNIFAVKAERAAAAGVHGHNHHAVPNFDPARLRHLDHFAGRFMAPKRVSRSGGESLVFGAHRRGMDFDDDPVILRFRRLNADDASLLFSAYGDLFHRRPVSPPPLNIDASAQSVF